MNLRLNDVFTTWKTGGGIFGYMARLPNVTLPWNTDAPALQLDMQYHGNHSGEKITSTLVDAYINTDNTISDDDKSVIALTAWIINGQNWLRLWNAIQVDYAPLNNYDMTENYTENGNNSDNGKSNSSYTHGETITNNGTNTETGTVNGSESLQHGETIHTEGENTNNIFGFNSSDAVHSNSDSGVNDETHGGVDATTTNETRNLSHGIDTSETHSGTDTNSGTTENSSTHEVNHTLTRKGNIGVTTSQQMLESEYELRKRNYFEMVFADIDKILTAPIY